MKIAVYMGLPSGGAMRTMEAVIERLNKRHEVILWQTPASSDLPTRFGRDIESWWLQSIKQKKLADKINHSGCDVALVTHDEHLQAPHLLKHLTVPSVFLCQEPTRVFFEKWIENQERIKGIKKLYEGINRKIRRWLEVGNAKQADKIMANSLYSIESIKRAYGVTSQAIYLGYDKSVYRAGTNKKKNVIMVVGNNEPQKDLSLAVRTVALLRTYELLIACPRKNDMRSIKSLAKKLGVKMRYVVGKSSKEMACLYSSARVTLATAHLEPFGLSVVESMACGTPVVAVSEGGFRETVTSGISGELTERDSRQLAGAVRKVVDSYDKYRDGALKRARAFDWDETTKLLEKLLESSSRLAK
jgi:glycosyltransferase involved in cell wall biosynthesis